jgi:mercuric ion binding protein
MRKLLVSLVALFGLGLAAAQFHPVRMPAAHAEESAALQTATFVVENMTCALCPVTVKKAMEGVSGVQSVVIDFEARSATVVFDPAATTPAAIAASSADAGYPATLKG